MPRMREYDDGDSQWEDKLHWEEYDRREQKALIREAKITATVPDVPNYSKMILDGISPSIEPTSKSKYISPGVSIIEYDDGDHSLHRFPPAGRLNVKYIDESDSE